MRATAAGWSELGLISIRFVLLNVIGKYLEAGKVLHSDVSNTFLKLNLLW